VDGWFTLRQDYEDLEPRVIELASRGLSFGMHVIASAVRWSEIRPRLRDMLGTKFELRLGDPMESEVGSRTAAAVPHLAGRGLTSAGHHFLSALPRLDGVSATGDLTEATKAAVAEIGTFWTGPSAPGVRLLPTRLPAEQLPPADGEVRACLGWDEQRLEPVWHDFAATPPITRHDSLAPIPPIRHAPLPSIASVLDSISRSPAPTVTPADQDHTAAPAPLPSPTVTGGTRRQPLRTMTVTSPQIHTPSPETTTTTSSDDVQKHPAPTITVTTPSGEDLVTAPPLPSSRTTDLDSQGPPPPVPHQQGGPPQHATAAPTTPGHKPPPAPVTAPPPTTVERISSEPIEFDASSTELDGEQGRLISSLASQVATSGMVRTSNDGPRPVVTVDAHATVAHGGRAHFGQSLQLSALRGASVAAAFREALGQELADRRTPGSPQVSVGDIPLIVLPQGAPGSQQLTVEQLPPVSDQTVLHVDLQNQQPDPTQPST